MCGICGFIKFDKRVSDSEKLVLEKMNMQLVHRGPDAQDTLVFDNVALGFTRLSIIGLGNGMQPIFNEDESLVLVCNGEIFNYIELRQQLQQRGHVFRTESDVEVIVHLYEEEGMDFVNKLNGQFAFALFDKKLGQLYCVRDHLGILPFFYTFAQNTFVFASEIKAILQHPAVIKEIDPVALDQVFTFAGLISPRTMFKNIHSLQNGHYLAINDRMEVKDVEYWDLVYPQDDVIENEKDEAGYIKELEELFEQSIRLRMRADVPSGLYVSGGLDSSMIAMKVSKMYPGVRKEAFSIDFMDSMHSESVYQQLIAKESNSLLNQKVFKYEDIMDRLRLSVYHSECPIKETYNTASMSLSEAVRNKGIKVIQSGEGADEFFAGYVGYRFDKMRAMKFIDNPSSIEERAIRTKLWGDADFFYEKNFTEFNQLKKQIYSGALADSFNEIDCLNHFVINKDKLEGRSLLNKRAYIDYKIRLVDHLVSDHGDRMAMANSIEVRYPFLDKDLVEFSTRLPTDLKLNEFTEKYILRQMAKNFVPPAVLNREKFHFIAPGSPYLIQRNSEYIKHLLSHDVIKKQGFFNPDKIDELTKIYSKPGFTINAPYETDILIIVITFGMLLDIFFES